jgi:hypothetical protein
MDSSSPVSTPNDTTGPRPGWRGRATVLVNPKPPAVPATLDLNLAEYYAAAAAMGLLAAQTEEPNKDWIAEWAMDFGVIMARKAMERRQVT